MIAGRSETAARRLTWKATLRGASIAAACTFGLLLAVLGAVYWYVPSLEEIHTRQAQIDRQTAVVASLSAKGGQATIIPCTDPHQKLRHRILTDETQGTVAGKKGETYRVIQED
jgi:hypothetical protein